MKCEISLENSGGFVLGKILQKMEFKLDKELEKFSIESKHYGLLLVVYNNENISQKKLGELMKIDRTTIMRLIDHLESLNYIKRVKNPEDRRYYFLKLPDKSKNIIHSIWDNMKNIEKEVLSDLTKSQNSVFNEFCSIVNENKRY